MQCSIFIEATKSNSGFKNITVACIAEERKALLKHKQGLKDPSGQLSTWVGEDCCKWTGVGCSNPGNVLKLDLPAFCSRDYDDPMWGCWSAELNPSLLNLTYLNYLDLSASDFKGTPIPSFLGSLKKLRYLDLSTSGFEGMVPPHLGNLSNLLVSQHTQICGFQIWIGFLVSLPCNTWIWKWWTLARQQLIGYMLLIWFLRS